LLCDDAAEDTILGLSTHDFDLSVLSHKCLCSSNVRAPRFLKLPYREIERFVLRC
jgi:hypothetical protein